MIEITNNGFEQLCDVNKKKQCDVNKITRITGHHEIMAKIYCPYKITSRIWRFWVLWISVDFSRAGRGFFKKTKRQHWSLLCICLSDSEIWNTHAERYAHYTCVERAANGVGGPVSAVCTFGDVRTATEHDPTLQLRRWPRTDGYAVYFRANLLWYSTASLVQPQRVTRVVLLCRAALYHH